MVQLRRRPRPAAVVAYLRAHGWLVIPLWVLVACGRVSGSDPGDRKGEEGSIEFGSAVTAKKVDDVWVFVGAAPEQESGIKLIGNDSLQGGLAKVERGCLTVDGEVVVFWPQQLDLVAEIVGSAKEVPPRQVSFPGGGTLASAPELVVEHCRVSSVRFAGRGAS